MESIPIQAVYICFKCLCKFYREIKVFYLVVIFQNPKILQISFKIYVLDLTFLSYRLISVSGKYAQHVFSFFRMHFFMGWILYPLADLALLLVQFEDFTML